MINSINSNQNYWSGIADIMQTSYNKANTSSLSDSDFMSVSQEEETEKKQRREEMSLEEHMQYMSESSANSDLVSTAGTTTTGDISDVDSDGDGTLSEDELEVLLEKMGISDTVDANEEFTNLDSDGDGEISEDEMNAARPPMGPPPGMPPMGPPPEESEDEELEVSSEEMKDAMYAYNQNYSYYEEWLKENQDSGIDSKA